MTIDLQIMFHKMKVLREYLSETFPLHLEHEDNKRDLTLY